jgi:YlmC/YmxH family sporulation protein
MRLSDLTGKEVINLGDGARLGVIDECELTFDSKSGRIHALVLPNRGGMFSFFSDKRNSTIPWQAIKRIGDEVIIVDLNNAFERMYTGLHREQQEDTY